MTPPTTGPLAQADAQLERLRRPLRSPLSTASSMPRASQMAAEAWSAPASGAPATAMYASPIVLIFSTPAASAASSSKRREQLVEEPDHPRRDRSRAAHGVKPARSAKRTVVSGYDSAIRASPRVRRAAIDGRDGVGQQLLRARLGPAPPDVGVAQQREREAERNGEVGRVPDEPHRVRLRRDIWLLTNGSSRIDADDHTPERRRTTPSRAGDPGARRAKTGPRKAKTMAALDPPSPPREISITAGNDQDA